MTALPLETELELLGGFTLRKMPKSFLDDGEGVNSVLLRNPEAQSAVRTLRKLSGYVEFQCFNRPGESDLTTIAHGILGKFHKPSC